MPLPPDAGDPSSKVPVDPSLPPVSPATPSATDAGADASISPPEAGPDIGASGPASCATAAPPTSGLAIWLQAGSGYTDDGAGNVLSWADKTGGAPATAPSTNQEPTLVPNGLNGKAVLHFKGASDDADQAALERLVPINGLTAMTVVFVNATDVLWKDDPTEWCHYAGCDGDPTTQVPGARLVSETGCSGTYQHVLWWNGAANPATPGTPYDWSGVFVTPKQEGIGFRFGNEVETYSSNPCDMPYDENVEWHRPASIGEKWTETVAIHDHLTNTLYADGLLAEQLPAPGSGDPAVYADDTLDVGNGFGWVDSHNQGGFVGGGARLHARTLGRGARAGRYVPGLHSISGAPRARCRFRGLSGARAPRTRGQIAESESWSHSPRFPALQAGLIGVVGC